MCRHVASKGEAAAKAREPVAIVITVELSNRYVSRYVAVPVAVALVGIAALATSLTPSYRPTDLVIGASATYVGLWVLLVAELSRDRGRSMVARVASISTSTLAAG